MKVDKILLLVLIAIVAIAAVIVWFNFTGNYIEKVPIYDANVNQPLIGGQTDEGGCLIGAGYSWCEPKQKCLRIWEEKCYENEEAALAQIFAASHKKPVTETNVTVVELKNNFTSGSISFGPETGEGGGFLARLVNGAWTIDYEGNGSVDCEKIKGLGYPKNVLEGYCD